MTPKLAVLRCGRCHEPVDEVLGFSVDLYGEPICRECHMKEWELREDGPK